uniref:Uncharacterized protein n=1 Tax=Pristionchus pacificus TaxID=54126 RepID=A0A2A6B9F8_PRIPA|eukprot:PDM62506.1 hypothetical protein PRIPAC_51948 [Pristionchus pacificus]
MFDRECNGGESVHRQHKMQHGTEQDENGDLEWAGKSKNIPDADGSRMMQQSSEKRSGSVTYIITSFAMIRAIEKLSSNPILRCRYVEDSKPKNGGRVRAAARGGQEKRMSALTDTNAASCQRRAQHSPRHSFHKSKKMPEADGSRMMQHSREKRSGRVTYIITSFAMVRAIEKVSSNPILRFIESMTDAGLDTKWRSTEYSTKQAQPIHEEV